MNFFKWMFLIIIWVSMIIAFVTGGFELVGLVKDASIATADENVAILDTVVPHLRNLSWVGLDLAVLFVGLKDSKEYFETKDREKDNEIDL